MRNVIKYLKNIDTLTYFFLAFCWSFLLVEIVLGKYKPTKIAIELMYFLLALDSFTHALKSIESK